jgi:hypothetical protein
LTSPALPPPLASPRSRTLALSSHSVAGVSKARRV